MTPEERSEIADAVAAGVRAALAENRGPVPGTLYTTRQASEITGLPENWLQEKAASGEIPSCKVGLYRKFSPAHLMAIVEAYEELPISGEKRKALISALAAAKSALGVMQAALVA